MEFISMDMIRAKISQQQELTKVERFLWYHQPGGNSHDTFRADLNQALQEAADGEGVLALVERLKPMAEGTQPIPSMITYANDVLRVREALRELQSFLSLEAVRRHSK